MDSIRDGYPAPPKPPQCGTAFVGANDTKKFKGKGIILFCNRDRGHGGKCLYNPTTDRPVSVSMKGAEK